MKANLSFFLNFRQYNSYSFNNNIVEKTFNNGNGSLSLFRFYENEKIILVNECLFNKSDERHLNEFVKINNMSDWTIKKVSYGYPDYYKNSFSLKLL